MEKVNFLPGPVNLHSDIFKDLSVKPISHRSEKFELLLNDICSNLSGMTKAKYAAIFTGSGTLANEVIAAQLKTMKGKGLIISNGEFGERLTDQAKRFSLKFKHLSYKWGETFNYIEVEEYILKNKPAWVWFVHLETSTGILNDLPRINKVCSKVKTKICLDIISSIGNMPVNLKNVFLASASSGKGLAGFCGLAIVFSNHIPASNSKIPKYLDLGYYYSKNKIPFTISHNLIFALNEELKRCDLKKRFEETEKISSQLIKLLESEI